MAERKLETKDPQKGSERFANSSTNVTENGEDCQCEVDRLTVVTISQPDLVLLPDGTTNVIRNAWFVAYFRNNGCCDCCEFRQYVRGYVEHNGVVLAPPVPGFDFLDWSEDEDDDGGHYGHRDEPAEPNNRYLPNQDTGCIYIGNDQPGLYGMSSGDDYFIYYEFVDVIIDMCNGDAVVAGPETWDMITWGTVP